MFPHNFSVKFIDDLILKTAEKQPAAVIFPAV